MVEAGETSNLIGELSSHSCLRGKSMVTKSCEYLVGILEWKLVKVCESAEANGRVGQVVDLFGSFWWFVYFFVADRFLGG